MNVDCEDEKLHRYAHYALRRSFLWNTWLLIKSFTNQNFLFSGDGMSSIFQKDMLMLIKQHYWSLVFFIKFKYLIETNILQIVPNFSTCSIVTLRFYFFVPKELLACPE